MNKELSVMNVDELQEHAAKSQGHLVKAQRVFETIGTAEFAPVSHALDISDATDPDFVDNALRIGQIKQALSENAIPTLQQQNEEVESEITNRVEVLERKVVQLQTLDEKGFLPTKEALTIAQSQLHNLKSRTTVQAVTETEQPSETSIQEELTSTVVPVQEQSIIIEAAQGESQPKKKTYRQEIYDLLRSGSFTYAEAALSIYGVDDRDSRAKISANLTQLPLKDDERIERTKSDKEPIKITIVTVEQSPKSEAEEKPKKESPLKHPISDRNASAIGLIMDGALIQKEIIDGLGLMKNGRPYHRGQAWAALRNATQFFFVRIKRKGTKNISDIELALWDKMKEKFPGEDRQTYESVQKTLADFFEIQLKQKEAKEQVDEREETLEQLSEDVEVKISEDTSVKEVSSSLVEEIETETVSEMTDEAEYEAKNEEETILLSSTPLPVEQPVREPKVLNIEKRVPDIRNEIDKSIKTVLDTGLQRIGHLQLSAILRVSTRNIINLQEKNFLKPGSSGKDHHPDYTQKEAVAADIMNKYRHGLTRTEVKEIYRLVDEAFAAAGIEEKNSSSAK